MSCSQVSPYPLCAAKVLSRNSLNAVPVYAGATGFLGSVVLERLLSNVPTLSRMSVIVRDKKGLTGASSFWPTFPGSYRLDLSQVDVSRLRAAPARVKRLLDHSDLFREWRKSKPNADCLDVIVGDTTLPMCGLSSQACFEVMQSVTHVIHCAASIAFDAPMHESLRQNYEVRILHSHCVACHTRS